VESQRLERETQIADEESKPVSPMVLAAQEETLDAIGVSRLAPDIQALIQRMFDGTEPTGRELKSWEVLKFNPRHVNIVVLRAAGFKGSEIEQITGYERANIYNTLSHPYGKKLVQAMQGQNSARVIDIRTRLEEYAGELLDHTFAMALKSEELEEVTKVTFGLLDRAGHSPRESKADRPKPEDIRPSESVMTRLAEAMEGSKSVDSQVMPTWKPRRPPEESFEDEAPGSVSVGTEDVGGHSRGSEEGSGSQAASRRTA
jgi:hypothetical protein